MEDVLDLFGILSDKTRLRILLLLLNRELCVCEIFAALDMSQPRVSRQLAVLKQSRMIKDRREGKWIFYRIDENDHTKRLMAILSLLPEWLNDDPQLKRDNRMLQENLAWMNKISSCACALAGGEESGK